MNKKIATILAGIMDAVLVMSLMLSLLATVAHGATSSEIKDEINALKQQQAALDAQIRDLENNLTLNNNEIRSIISRKNGIDQQVLLINQQISLINIRKLSGNDSAAAASYVKLPHFWMIFYGVTASRSAWPAQIIVDPHFHIALLRFFKRESYIFKPFFGKKNRLGKTAGGKNKKFLYPLLLHKIQLAKHFRKLHFIFPRPPRNRIKICRRIGKIIFPTVHYILCN